MLNYERYISDPKQLLLQIYGEDIKEFEKTRKFALEEDGVKFEDLERIENCVILPEWIRETSYLNYVVNSLMTEYRLMVKKPDFFEYEFDKNGEIKKININYSNLTTYLAKKYAIITYNDTVFAYIYNRYVEAENLILSEIEHLCTIFDSRKYLSLRRISTIKKEVISRLKDKTRVFSYPFKRFDDIIFVKNGALFLEHKLLLPHGAFWFNDYRINAEFNPCAESERLNNFIDSLVPEDKRKLLYTIPACCLISKTDKAFMLVGEGANGKSTYLNFLRSFLGVENCASIALQDLVNDRFKSAELLGKIANIYADLPEKPLKDSGKFKILTGEDFLTVERKYHHPFQMKNQAVMIFSCNRLPEVNDETHAFWRRFILIEFPYKFKEDTEFAKWAQNPHENDLSAFLNKVLEAISEIKLIGLRVSETTDLKELWKRNNDSVYAFVKDCIELSPQDYVLKDVLYSRYVEYCDENNYRALPKNFFAQKLLSHIPVKAERRRIAGERVHVWVGIRLKQTEEQNEDSEAVAYDLSNLQL